MNTNKDFLQVKWSALKSEIRKQWGKITDDDLKNLNGKTEDLINVLRRRYGYGKAQAEIEIGNWLKDLKRSRAKSKT